MRTSQYLLSTLKETPADAEVISHQLMLRAGMIRKLASGLYTWLPTGVRVLKKVENIVREEMNNAGAIEVLMPVVQPSELWQESGRWEQYGPELLRIADRGDRPFVLGPTHEEVITDLIRNELSSYKQLPLNFFQIQTKFRDEVRPRFGVMRSREFLMKDAYSFHTSQESLQETYDKMYVAYSKIFSRMGLDFRAVQADTGSIGGSASHEFQVLAQSGEDDVIFSDSSDYAANIEFAEALAPKEPRGAATQEMTLVDTPNAKTIAELVEQFNLPIEKTVKTLLVKSAEGSAYPLVALLVRGDHELNEVKAEKLPQVASPLTFATEAEIRAVVNAGPGSLGPVNMPVPAPRRQVWIATSTHDGEEAIILQAHRQLLEKFPDLLLILVPRHPERFKDAREMVQKGGFSFTLRSSGEIPSGSTQVVIGDTMGELMLLYGIADLAFVGGSLVERGGHNPLEPAAHAIPVLMGPHTFNFKDICAKLQQADGLITVTDADSVVKEVSTLLTDEDYRLWYGRHAVEVLHQNQGALTRLLQLLQPYLPQRSH